MPTYTQNSASEDQKLAGTSNISTSSSEISQDDHRSVSKRKRKDLAFLEEMAFKNSEIAIQNDFDNSFEDLNARDQRLRVKIDSFIKKISDQLAAELNQNIESQTATSSHASYQDILKQKKYVSFGIAPSSDEYSFKLYIKGQYDCDVSGKRISSYKGLPFFILEKANQSRKRWKPQIQTANKTDFDLDVIGDEDLTDKIILHWSHALGNANYGNETSLNAQLATMAKSLKNNKAVGQGEMQSYIEATLKKIKNDMPDLPLLLKFTDYIDDKGRLHTRRYKIFSIKENQDDKNDYEEILIGDIYLPGLIAFENRDHHLFKEYQKRVDALYDISEKVDTYLKSDNKSTTKGGDLKKRTHKWDRTFKESQEMPISKRHGKMPFLDKNEVSVYRDYLLEDKKQQKATHLHAHARKSGDKESIQDNILELLKEFIQGKFKKNKANSTLSEKIEKIDFNKDIYKVLKQCVEHQLLKKGELQSLFTAILDSRFGVIRPNSELLEKLLIEFRK